MPSRVPAAEQALDILRLLARRAAPMPAGAIARELNLPRSTTYHLLSVLAARGFVTHLPEERSYGLGVTAFEIGSAYLRRDPLERLARPLLKRLVDTAPVPAVGHLGILHGRETLYLLKDVGSGAPTLVTDVGVRLPAHLTASGRALLAALPSAQVRALFPSREAFVDRTGRGPASLPELRRVLADERQRGWCVEDGEISVGFASVAAPALDHTGRPAASIGLTFYRDQVPHDRWPELAALAIDSARILTTRLRGRTNAAVATDGTPSRQLGQPQVRRT